MRFGGFGFTDQFGFSVPPQGETLPFALDTLGQSLATLEAAGKLVCAWYLPTADPDYYLQLSGSSVVGWLAAYGSQRVNLAEATNQPAWDATLFSNKGGVVFDGTNDCLTGTGNVTNWPDNTADLYMLAATRQDAATVAAAKHAFAYGTSTISNRTVGVLDVSSERRALAFAASTGITGTSGVFTGAHTVGCVFDIGGTSAVYFDGASDGTASTAAPALTRTRVRLGANAASTAGSFWNGVIVAAAILNSTASLTDFTDLEALMRARLS